MKKSMSEFAKSWKSPEQRREDKVPGDVNTMAKQKKGNDESKRVAKKESASAPKNTTGMKGGKNTADSRGGSMKGAMMSAVKKPKMMKGQK